MNEKKLINFNTIQENIVSTQKLTDSVRPIIEQQEKIKEIMKPITVDVPTIDNPLKDAITNETFTGLSKAITAKPLSLMESFENSFNTMIYDFTSEIKEAITSPLIKWIQTVVFSPFISVIQNLNLDNFDPEKFERLNERYLLSMYDCKWFPYAGWNADISVFTKVNEILNSSRGISKRCKNRIDKVILRYYTKSEIKQIKREWRNSDLKPHIKKILGQALEAHLRGEYVLSICCLSTMWEGLIQNKSNVTGRQQSKYVTENLKSLIEENEEEEIFNDFYNNFIVSQCNTNDDVIDGIPNRNAVSHSKYKKYPNKKASLNAILLTDFIIKLNPKKDIEEKINGQNENANAE